MTPPQHPRGQILVIAAAAMIVLMAIGAIVVDLGLSWILHRQEQNAADPGAVAAAKWVPTGDYAMMKEEACFYAQQNGFFTGDLNCANALQPGGDLQVLWPPQGDLAGGYGGNPAYVEVVIRSTHTSFFGQFFGQPFASVRTAAVASNAVGNANTSSLVALQDVCSGGAGGTVTGGGTLNIFPANPGVTQPGGYVNINSPCGSSTDDNCTNGVGEAALKVDGGSTLVTPFAFVRGSCTLNGGATFQCAPGVLTCLDEGAQPLTDPLMGIPEPNIGDFPAPACPNGLAQNPNSGTGCDIGGGASQGPGCIKVGSDYTCTLEPGVYYGGWKVASKTTVHLKPGMYILAGGGIQLSGSSDIDSVAGPGGIPPRITIFSTDGPRCPAVAGQCQGNITFTADQGFVAKATNTASCQALVAAGWANICPWRGMLLWQDGTVNAYPAFSTIKLGGQASSVLSGTIYAPRADVTINGGSGTTGCSGSSTASCLSIQIVSWTWKIDGNATVDMPYDPAELYPLSQRGLVH